MMAAGLAGLVVPQTASGATAPPVPVLSWHGCGDFPMTIATGLTA
jgi:hypothetical protein